MFFKKWSLWKFIIKRAARTYGFLDPVTLMARLRRFGHPSEVHEPIELIRAGVVFHARGLINTRAIQYNLDWVWPYWIVKQFRPNDESFIPRGFSFSHVNLTNRNWTAVGHPEMPWYPIIDPKGLVTPYLDGWSIDFWIRRENGTLFAPSETGDVKQELIMDENQIAVSTNVQNEDVELNTKVTVEQNNEGFFICIRAEGIVENGGRLVLSLRPYNPEGIQFIDKIEYDPQDKCFSVNGNSHVKMDTAPEKVCFSNYTDGDVSRMLDKPEPADSITCDIGMATAAAVFPPKKEGKNCVTVTLPLIDDAENDTTNANVPPMSSDRGWQSWVSKTATLEVPDEKIQFLYDAAIRTLLLLSADDIVPGPYTYKRFWFRDACLMINALLAIGLPDRALRMIKEFPKRQTMGGYFQSQEGEWDSNGQVLWIAGRYHDLVGLEGEDDLLGSLFKGADWITKKRIKKDPDKPHYGLFPAGFSAEHLGPNDYYYWDDFWGVSGLYEASRLAGEFHSPKKQTELHDQADDFLQQIVKCIDNIPEKRRKGGIPASPYRRMDAGAIGSLVADYPLQLFKPNEPMTMNTVSFLMDNCFHSGAFFQDMIHSGLNIYLTLDIAQTLLRAGDPAYRQLIRTVAELASPTGQWPEAIHPFTKGGCMGDGQHGWAAAEWLMMIRNLFIREEENMIIIGSGLFPEWIESGQKLVYGPTLIPGGRISVVIQKKGDSVDLDMNLDTKKSLEIIADIPGYQKQVIHNSSTRLERKEK